MFTRTTECVIRGPFTETIEWCHLNSVTTTLRFGELGMLHCIVVISLALCI